MKFGGVPFVRFLLPFIVGIVTCIFVFVPIEISLSLLLISFALFIVFCFVPTFSSYKQAWINGVISAIFFFSTGALITSVNTGVKRAHHYSNYLDGSSLSQFAIITIHDLPIKKERSLKTVVSVDAIKNNSGWEGTKGKALLYLEKDSITSQLKYGDKLIVKTNFNVIDAPKNPQEFDRKQYLSYNDINYQTYVNGKSWELVSSGNGNRIIDLALNFRNELLNVFKQNNITGQEYSVAAALILGYVDELDQETMQAYALTGAMHVLSVSGLHVGILFILFSFITKGFIRFKYGKTIRAIVLLIIIWLYALLTGLSPSVQRSTMMFSFLVIAESLRKQTNIYNTIAASAFLLLFIDPYALMNVGFQLSYLAVLGIVYIYPKLFEFWSIENKIIKPIWSLTCVSIAAQITTFPLCLFYFHQFPNYFLFSNLLVIPLSTLVLYGGILLLMVSKIVWLSTIVAKGLVLLLKLLNGSVDFFSRLPGNSTNGIYISFTEMFMITFIIICLLMYFESKRISWIFASLTLFIALLVVNVIEQRTELEQKKIIVYDTPAKTNIDLVSAKQVYTISADSVFPYYILRNRQSLGINDQNSIDFGNKVLFFKDNFLKFYNKEFYFLLENNFSVDSAVPVNYVVVSNDVFVDVKRLQQNFKFDKVIIDASNSKKNNRILKKIFQQNNVPYYSVIDSGAYIINL